MNDVDPRAAKLASQILGFIEISDGTFTAKRIIITAHLRGALARAWEEGREAGLREERGPEEECPYVRGCS